MATEPQPPIFNDDDRRKFRLPSMGIDGECPRCHCGDLRISTEDTDQGRQRVKRCRACGHRIAKQIVRVQLTAAEMPN